MSRDAIQTQDYQAGDCGICGHHRPKTRRYQTDSNIIQQYDDVLETTDEASVLVCILCETGISEVTR